MPSITFTNEAAGPILEVGISVNQPATVVGMPPTTTVWVKAIADTGASHTCISSSCAARAGLPLIGKQAMRSATQEIAVNQYFGDLWIKATLSNFAVFHWKFPNMRFLQLGLPGDGHEALVGMDILAQGMLVVNGATRSTTFAW